MQVAMSAELAQAILNYLSTQPYAQVHSMIAGIQQAKPIEDNEKCGSMSPSEQDKQGLGQ